MAGAAKCITLQSAESYRYVAWPNLFHGVRVFA